MSAMRAFGSSTFWGNLWSHYAFIHDEYRLRPNITMNIGLRYEYVGVPDASKTQSLNAVASVPGLIDFHSPSAKRGNWAPRIGFAWTPGKQGNTSVRASFGMAYDQVFQNLGLLTLPPQFYTLFDATAGPTDNTAGFLANGGIPGPTGSTSSMTAAEARARTASFVPDQKRPYSVNWTLGVQRIIARDYTVEVRYLGTRGVHLPVFNRRSIVALSSHRRTACLRIWHVHHKANWIASG